MMYTYFTAMKNSRGVPLAYVIGKTPDLSGIFIDREQEIIQNAPLKGNMKVLAILKELTVNTDAETWMKGRLCFQESMLALYNHYDSKSEGERRKQVAKEYLKTLFYRENPLSLSIIT